MNQNTNVRTAPFMAGAVLLAVGVILAIHLAGFHFVTAGQVSLG